MKLTSCTRTTIGHGGISKIEEEIFHSTDRFLKSNGRLHYMEVLYKGDKLALKGNFWKPATAIFLKHSLKHNQSNG